MPIRGPKPKSDALKRTRNRLTHEWTEVENVPFHGAPRLPTEWINGLGWPKRTRALWKTWSTMPHCVLWTPADWAFATDTLMIAASFHTTGETKFATELRNREKIIGTTAEFRRDLRIRYIDPRSDDDGEEDRDVATVTDIANYRDL